MKGTIPAKRYCPEHQVKWLEAENVRLKQSWTTLLGKISTQEFDRIVRGVADFAENIKLKKERDALRNRVNELDASLERTLRSTANAKRTGYKEGLTAEAHWKDGVQYVGTCGKTLKEALEE